MKTNKILQKKEAQLEKSRLKELKSNHTTKTERFTNKVLDNFLVPIMIGLLTILIAIPFMVIPLAGNAPIGLIAVGIGSVLLSLASFGTLIFSKIFQNYLDSKYIKICDEIDKLTNEIEKLKNLSNEKGNIREKSINSEEIHYDHSVQYIPTQEISNENIEDGNKQIPTEEKECGVEKKI